MIQHAARRACSTSLKYGRLPRWRVSTNAQPPFRSRSAGPFVVAPDVWTNPDPNPNIGGSSSGCSTVALPIQAEKGISVEGEGEAISVHGERNVECTSNRALSQLGQDVSRLVRSSPDVLNPEILDIMVNAGTSETRLEAGAAPGAVADTFAVIAKAYRKQRRQHLTLQLCEAFEEATGETLIPRSAQGLVLLLDAMKPSTARHAEGGAGGGAGGGGGGGGRWRRSQQEGEQAVKDLLARFEGGGQTVPLLAYKAAVKALDGPDCSVALEMARQARAKLGDDTEGLGELYGLVMQQCGKRQAPDLMREILEERRNAGGGLSPDAHAYAMALGCLGKAKRVTETLELFGEMVEAGEKPSAIAVNNVLAACAREPRAFWKHANAIFEDMEKSWGIKPNVHHYTTLVTCLLKAGKWGEAIAMTDRMEGDSITPNTRFLDHMMQASVSEKQWVTAEAIFRAMTEKYGHSNVVSRQSTMHFIQSMVMQKKLRKVISYVSRVQDLKLKGKSQKGTMDAALLKWFRMIPGVTSEAMAGLLMTMVDKGVRVHPDSYSIVISKANQDGNRELSETLYNFLLASGGSPSLSAANAAVKGAKTIDEALEIVASLSREGLSPDKFTYAALLHCCSAAVDDKRQGQKATQVWEAMYDDGIVPHGGMLASYLLGLMRSGEWKLALEVRERYRDRDGSEGFKLARAERHVGRLELVARESAVVDGVVANGLVDNEEYSKALSYVQRVLKDRKEGIPTLVSPDGAPEDGPENFVDEDNHTVLAGVRACRHVGSCEMAMGLLAGCEARWATEPPPRDAGGEDVGAGGGKRWSEMLVATRLSRRRLYDSVVQVLDIREQKFDDIRRVLESGMRKGIISLMKDQQGSTSAEQGVEFHGWSIRTARCIVRCIVEDLARDKDFLLEMDQYNLGRAVEAQGLREFGEMSERWHVDSPDPRGRRRVFADGKVPARFAEREYGKGRKQRSEKSRWQKPSGGWDGRGSDETQARWWEKDVKLSLIVGRPRPPPCIRNAVEEFCMLEVSPPLRVRKDAINSGILTIEPTDVRAWLERDPRVLH